MVYRHVWVKYIKNVVSCINRYCELLPQNRFHPHGKWTIFIIYCLLQGGKVILLWKIINYSVHLLGFLFPPASLLQGHHQLLELLQRHGLALRVQLIQEVLDPQIVIQVMVESFKSKDDFFDVDVSILLSVELSEEFLKAAGNKKIFVSPRHAPQHWPPAQTSFLRLSCLTVGLQ